MVVLERIEALYCTSEIDYLKSIYDEAFPSCEQRDWGQILELNLSDSPLEMYRIWATELSSTVGFVTLWRTDRWLFGEHLAIDPCFRNRGWGASVVRMIQIPEFYRGALILEVEPPVTEIASRRLSFYEREGMSIVDRNYLQPDYQRKGNHLPLFLLSNAEWSDSTLSRTVSEIYQNVYAGYPSPLVP